jgi:signal peptidase I
MANKNKSEYYVKEALQWIKAIVLAVIISLIIRGFVFETVLVEGSSMENTFTTGDRLILYKLGYYFSPPAKGDIIVIQISEGAFSKFPLLNKMPFVKKALPDLSEIDYIKRVIGVPGDIVEFKEGAVYVNGEKLNEQYAKGPTYCEKEKIEVEEHKVFVLGDNRLDSKDSREIGLIDFDKIRGKVILKIWPPKH